MQRRAPSVVVDRSSEEPVYAQVARQLRGFIAAGQLGPGAALPSVRTLASDLGVNLNTVARAYRLLAEEGFLELRQRSGARVIAPRRRGDAQERERLLEELRSVLARLRQAGVAPERLHELAAREIDALARDDDVGGMT